MKSGTIWRTLFSSAVLNRGRTYNFQGRVVNYALAGNTIHADVLGSGHFDS